MSLRHFLDPLQVRTMNHYVHVFGVSNGSRLDPVYMDHDSAAADQLERNLRGGQNLGDPLQRANQGEQTLFEHGIDESSFLSGFGYELFEGHRHNGRFRAIRP
jgi:hypothetical protein